MIQQEPILIIQNSQIKPASTNIFASNSKTTKTLLLLIIRTSVESAQTRNLSGHSLSSMRVFSKSSSDSKIHQFLQGSGSMKKNRSYPDIEVFPIVHCIQYNY